MSKDLVVAYWVEYETGSFHDVALGPADLRGKMDYAAHVRLKLSRRPMALTVIPVNRVDEGWARAAIEHVRGQGAARRSEIAGQGANE